MQKYVGSVRHFLIRCEQICATGACNKNRVYYAEDHMFIWFMLSSYAVMLVSFPPMSAYMGL